MNQNPSWFLVIAALCVGVSLIAAGSITTPAVPGPTPVVVVPGAPSAEMQAIVVQIKTIADTKPDVAKAVGRAFRDLATILPHAGLKTNGDLVAIIAKFESIYGPSTSLKGGLPGFSVAANAAMKQSLGDDDVALNQARAVETLNAIAWACGG
ncbi:hypothetical protein NA78x_001756 [Anatilimnocola sp. NA78]|uniref:hypothetical protein n=1 Tax=Anatilimnocola sp. NA78 TaxID=3415683 RepID=UPI003CE485F4